MTVKAIIPCAGFGTRMNLEPWQSKEMLTDPVTRKYLIDYSLDLCYIYNIRPVVITRHGKKELIDYIKDHSQDIDLVICEPGKEWAETVLKSQGLWGEKSILMLPDTRFNPESCIPEMIDKLRKVDVVAAVHKIHPSECNKWGVVTNKFIHEKAPVINVVGEQSLNAWGLLGWNNQAIGLSMFSDLTPNQSWESWDGIATVELDSFKDITRTGKLEKY